MSLELYEGAIICMEYPNPQKQILFKTNDEKSSIWNKALEEFCHEWEVNRFEANKVNEQWESNSF